MIPIAAVPDVHQIEALKPFVEFRRCLVVGSAPLSARFVDMGDEDIVIAVNGGISSVQNVPDVWVLNSKQQDQPGQTMRPLHQRMLEQGARRHVRHVLFLRGPKVASEHGTLQRLAHQHSTQRSWSVFDKVTKRWIEGELCGRTDDKRPCSSGILTVALALFCGAAHVRMEGFSLIPGYHYLPKDIPQTWWRDHVAADSKAIICLKQRYGDRLTHPAWTKAA